MHPLQTKLPPGREQQAQKVPLLQLEHGGRHAEGQKR